MRFGYASVSPDTGQSASFDVTKVFSLAVKSLNALFPTSDCVRTGEGERRRKKNIFWGEICWDSLVAMQKSCHHQVTLSMLELSLFLFGCFGEVAANTRHIQRKGFR